MNEGDGCTLWPDAVGDLDWRHCCEIHDAAYLGMADKWIADLSLMDCVAQSGAPLMGLIMFVGVTIFGGLWYWRRRHRGRHKP